MHSPTLKAVEEMMIQIRQDALAEGVSDENLSSVILARTIANLMSGNGYVLDTRNAPSSQIQFDGLSMFDETFSEWANHFKLETHCDRCSVAALYLYEKKGVKEFNTRDIEKMYDLARWKKSQNMAARFADCAARMFFAEVQESESTDTGLKLWKLTRTGYTYLQGLRIKGEQNHDE